jgi:AcrR family transcriptional regulator
MSETDTPPRRQRADAQRNRERLLEVAKAAFTELGADVGLDEIARRAGLGIGTLYRHFPTRDAVLEAVYRREVEQLAASAERLLAEFPPIEAMRQWLVLFVDYLATKKVIAPALRARPGGTSALYETSGGLIRATVGRLLARAIAVGEVRAEVEAADIVQALAGLSYGTGNAGWRESALRLIGILIAGLRCDPR